MRRALRWASGTMIAAGGLIVAAMACGPGDLRYLTEGDGASPTEPGVPEDPCKHAVAPRLPSKQEEKESLTVTFVIDNMRLDTGQDPKNGLTKAKGLDLDNTCSCGVADAAPSCIPPAGVKVPCDDSQGRDNETGSLINFAIAGIPGFGPDAIYDRIQRGLFSLVIRVAAWNGTPNDEAVAVSIVTSAGIDNPKDPATANIIPPKWDGNDRWTVEPGSINNGDAQLGLACDDPKFPIRCDPKTLDIKAYVADGKLVANFAEVPFAFGITGARINIPFKDGTLLASISRDGSRFKLDGEIAGRWPTESILYAVANTAIVDDEDPDAEVQALCTGSTYPFFRDNLCKGVDLAPRAADDGKGKKCTALSQSVRFTAQDAKLGTVKRSVDDTGVNRCPPNLPTTCPE